MPPWGLVYIKKDVLPPCGSLQALPTPSGAWVSILLKRIGIQFAGACVQVLVPPWGLVNDIKKDVLLPCGSLQALPTPSGAWVQYIIKKDWYIVCWSLRIGFGAAVGQVNDIKKDVLLPWGLVYSSSELPTPSGASVRRVCERYIASYPCMWLIIGTCKQLSLGA